MKRLSKAAMVRLVKNRGLDFTLSMSALVSPNTQPKPKRSLLAEQIAAQYKEKK